MLVARLLLLSALAILGSCQDKTPDSEFAVSGLRLDTLLGDSEQGFAKASAHRAFEFPGDHGPHPQYRSEWWYLTGVLEDEAGNDYGLHYTLFRQALSPEPAGEGPWLNGQAYLGHLAVTDVRAGQHFESERFARGHPELAGVSLAGGFSAVIEDWSLAGSIEPNLSLSLTAAEAGRFGVNLAIEQQQPVVLQGDSGWSEKGPGSASYYYSMPRLNLSGTLKVGERQVEVRGLGWLDREWSTSVLGEGLTGWDWFALQLDDERSVMAFQLRRKDGQRDPYDHGLLVEHAALPDVEVADARTDGVTLLKPEDFELTPTRYHTDPSGTQWPVAWQMILGEEVFTIRALVDEQRVDLSIVYWEGIVEVLNDEGQRIGRGYMELTGYAESS